MKNVNWTTKKLDDGSYYYTQQYDHYVYSIAIEKDGTLSRRLGIANSDPNMTVKIESFKYV